MTTTTINIGSAKKPPIPTLLENPVRAAPRECVRGLPSAAHHGSEKTRVPSMVAWKMAFTSPRRSRPCARYCSSRRAHTTPIPNRSTIDVLSATSCAQQLEAEVLTSAQSVSGKEGVGRWVLLRDGRGYHHGVELGVRV